MKNIRFTTGVVTGTNFQMDFDNGLTVSISELSSPAGIMIEVAQIKRSTGDGNEFLSVIPFCTPGMVSDIVMNTKAGRTVTERNMRQMNAS